MVHKRDIEKGVNVFQYVKTNLWPQKSLYMCDTKLSLVCVQNNEHTQPLGASCENGPVHPPLARSLQLPHRKSELHISGPQYHEQLIDPQLQWLLRQDQSESVL